LEDPYKTLGLPRSASQDDVRDAYRKLAKRHHPDLNPGNVKAEEEFKKISSANELLSDPEKRGRFDRGEIDAAGQERASGPSYRDHADHEAGRRYSQAGRQTGGWSDEDLGDIFGSMFGEGGQRGNIPIPGRDENYTLTTQLLDAINGATRRLTLPDGRTLDVKIPPGTVEGQVLRLRGQGGEGRNGAPRGDAFIAIHIEPHRYFVRDGNDVRLMLPVTLSEAVIGGSVQVPTPRGPVMMRIPPHSDSGTELRLRGRGVPEHHGKSAGDLYATLRVIIGTQDKSLQEFLTGWKPENPVNPRRSMEERP
jgi:DnaJ-class molecular chaperone